MDLAYALELARRGRPQAPADLGDGEAPRLDDVDLMDRARAREDRRCDAADLGMTPADAYAMTERVAERLARQLTRRHWYDLAEERRAWFRALARVAIRAVSGAQADRRANGARAACQGPMERMSVAEIEEREALAEIAPADLKRAGAIRRHARDGG